MAKYFKEESRANWYTTKEMSSDDLKVGALLRMADSLEKMEKPFAQLLSEREQYQRWYNEEKAKRRKMEKQLAAYKGIINRLKKQK